MAVSIFKMRKACAEVKNDIGPISSYKGNIDNSDSMTIIWMKKWLSIY